MEWMSKKMNGQIKDRVRNKPWGHKKSNHSMIPIAGGVGTGMYAYYDTAKVGAAAIELFSSNTDIE